MPTKSVALFDNGIIRLYVANIQGSGSGEKMKNLAGRTNSSDFIILNEVNKLIGSESAIPMRCKAKFLTNTPATGLGCGFGTFIGTVDYDAEKDYFERDDKFEIGMITRKFAGDISLSVIGMYRSPNMNANDTADFYRRLGKLIEKSMSNDSIVVAAGDDNSHPDGQSFSARAAFERLEQLRRRLGGIHLVNQPTHRSGYQPDHVLCFHNPIRFSATALPPLPGVGDHYEMRIDINLKSPVVPKQKWFKKEVTVSDGDHDMIERHLNQTFSDFTDDSFERIARHSHWSQAALDRFLELVKVKIEKVRAEHRVTKKCMMPSYPSERKTEKQRKLNFILNKIARVQRDVAAHPENVKLKEKLYKLTQEYPRVCAEVSQEILEKDIAMMRKGSKPNVGKLFAEAKRRHKFDDNQILLSKDQIDKKLLEAEQNYVRPDGCPEFSPADFADIEADAVFKLNPTVEKSIAIVESLSKVDSFYKRHKKSLAKPLTFLLKIIDRVHLFPSECKKPNLTFLPNRTIFSLDFFAKFFERAIRNSWDELEEVDEHGQFAYKKNRSCELLVAIGLHRAELEEDPCFCIGIDSKKAFDTCYWPNCSQNLQKKFGAGKFFYNYTQNRSYKFGKSIGFQAKPMGRGCPPGTILGPGIFGDFQTTDVEMTLKSKHEAWIWPGLFSDDKQGIAKWSKVRDGSVQKALDSTVSWSKQNFVKYHMQGKKKPASFVFRKKTHDDFDFSDIRSLRFDGQPIERQYDNFQLGICHRFFKDGEPANDYGYELEWRSKKSDFDRLANSFQDVKHTWEPDWIRTCVNAYMVGVLQYASALYWLRASEDSKTKARFAYCMSLAACMGLETPELIGLTDCKRRAVPEHRQRYHEACKFLNMPTLKDMAIKNARNIVRQWAIYEPELFIDNPDKFELGAEYENGLLFDLVNLANEEVNDWYPVYNAGKKEFGLSDDMIKTENWPEYKRLFEKGGEAVTQICGHELKNAKLLAYFFACKARFKCVEAVHRVKKRLPAECLPLENRGKKRKRKPNSSAISGSAKRLKTGDFSCAVERPRRAGKVAVLPCRICGYAIGKKSKKVDFECCDSSAHHKCWVNAGEENATAIECSKLASLLERDRTTAKFAYEKIETVSQPAPTTETTTCVDCSMEISLDDNRHTMFQCPALNRYYEPTPGEDYSTLTPLMMRSAALVRNRVLRSTPYVPMERDPSPRRALTESSPRSSLRGLPLRGRASSLRGSLLRGDPSRTAWQSQPP